MFWKKDKDSATVTAEKKSHKEKKETPRDLMMEQISVVAPGEEITYRLGDIYVKPFITVVHNTQGKRYSVFQDGKDVEGKPAGGRGKLWDANNNKDIAKWIIEREGTLYAG